MNKSLSPTIIGVLVCGLVVLLGPLYAGPMYDVIANTPRKLGAQDQPFNWVMNWGFVILGVGVGLDARSLWWRAPFSCVVFMLFSVGLVLTSMFSPRPVDLELPYNITEDALHSLFAAIAGFTFVVGVISFSFWNKNKDTRRISMAVVILSAVFSYAGHQWPAFQGLLERTFYLMAFAWLILFLPGNRGISKS